MATMNQKIFLNLYEKITRPAVTILKSRINNMDEEERLFWRGRFNCTRITRGISLQKPVIVCHGASVGELNGIIPLINRLKNSSFSGSIIVSTGTFSGYRKITNILKHWSSVFALPAPLDTQHSIKLFLSETDPDVFTFFEAEYWPRLYYELSRRKIPALLLNGRVSRSSYRKYKILKPFIKWIFQTPVAIGVVSQQNKHRLIELGARPEVITISGNSKYDYIFDMVSEKQGAASNLRKKLKPHSKTKIFIAGNLRREECHHMINLILELSREFPEVIFVLVPRHTKRVKEMQNHLRKHKLPFCLLSEVVKNNRVVDKEKVVIVDFIGVLFELYGIGDVNFCGGTLAPIGGHNIVEPVAWGKRVIYGPHVFKVHEEHKILSEYGASVMVKSYEELRSVISSFLKEPVKATLNHNIMGKVKSRLTGASEIYFQWIMDILYQENSKWNN